MEVLKQEDNIGLKIFLKEKRDYISFVFGGNGDLYLSMNKKYSDNDYNFTITKENYGVFSLFEQLFVNMKNNDERFYYEDLYNEEENEITWYSDEVAREVSNILKIKQDKDAFYLKFLIQPSIEGYEDDFHFANYIPIRFRSSGSSYGSFYLLFMELYRGMKEVDDVLDDGHQIHIEEYLYNENVKRLVKKKENNFEE